MMLKRSTRQSKTESQLSGRLVRAGVAGLATVTAVAGLATGCLDRKLAEPKPTTSNVFVDQIVQTAVDKIDLLFMIDNSVSMADKQAILEAAVPVLLNRLVKPICVDTNGAPVPGGGNADPLTGACGTGVAEFSPITDIHIGIVSSSLGAHGGDVCLPPASTDPNAAITFNDDQAHLIGTVRPGLTTWNNNSGFLAWDPAQKDMPPGEKDATALGTNFAAMVKATGEHGCGYEASLESWYRFLVDPEPPATVALVKNQTVRQGSDKTLLNQRAAFLRPDSLVAIVMLSDENDCSIRDDGFGWFVSTSKGGTARMPKATAACATNPNDKCCRSCAQAETKPPDGCSSLDTDPVCMGAPAGSYNKWDANHDDLNLRCFNQKQRFGFDLLYPTSRYVTALTATSLTKSDGTVVTNPLYDPGTSGKPPRDPSLVFLAGIVGVPWQDISDAASLASKTALNYLTAKELTDQGRWATLIGDSSASPPVAPTDPFMRESPTPRTGQNPITMDVVKGADSTSPTASPINGHEQYIGGKDNTGDQNDLEFACTFPLSAPRVCAAGDNACDCSPATAMDASAVTAANSPLCQPPAGGAAGTTQYFAKAYPGVRELQVLKDYGDNAIVASICPKVVTSANPSTDPNYGYNPAVAAIIDRLKEALKGKCLPRAIETDPKTGQVECEVIEAQKAGKCNCDKATGRQPADPAINSAVLNQLESSKTCGNLPNQTPCSIDAKGFCLCEIVQETMDGLSQCQQNSNSGPPGYCYIDDTVTPPSPALKNCPDNQKRLLKFVGSSTNPVPAQGATAFIACLGANVSN